MSIVRFLVSLGVVLCSAGAFAAPPSPCYLTSGTAVACYKPINVASGGTGVAGTATYPTSGTLVTLEAANVFTVDQQIGSSTGSAHIDTTAGDPAAPTYTFVGDLDTGIYRNSSNVLSVATAGINSALFDSSAIYMQRGGTSGQGANLIMRKSNGTVASPTIVADNDTLMAISVQGYGTAYSTAAQIVVEVDGTPSGTSDMPSRMLFKTSAEGSSSPTTHFQISSAGTSSFSGTAATVSTLTASGSSGSAGQVVAFENTYASAPTTSSTALWVGFSGVNDATNGNYIRFYDADTSTTGSIRGVNATTLAYNTSSDARLKKNVRELEGGLATVLKMKPRRFTWKKTEQEDIGFLAQELRQVYPGVVSGDPNGDVKIDPMQVEYGKLTPVLVAAIQELSARNAELAARIAKLEAQ